MKKKKKWPWILAAIIVIGIIGSQATGDGDNKPNETTKTPVQNASQEDDDKQHEETTKAPEDEINGLGAVVTLNDVEVHFIGFEVLERTTDDNIYLVPEFEIVNNSRKELNISSMMSFDFYVDGYAANTNLGGLMASDKKQLDGTIAPDKKMKGIVACETTADWQELEIVFSPSAWSNKKITFTHQNEG